MREPLVLLPGMMCDGRLFAPQVAAFSGGHPVMTMPLTGRSSVQGLAADILSRTPDRFALAGLSMGGIVAMEVIRQAPERVSRLALLDTNPNAELVEVAAGREPQIQTVHAGGLRKVMREEMKPKYLAKVANRQAILDLCMEMATSLGAQVFVDQSRALKTRPDQRKTLRHVGVPTLVLCGALDTVCPPQRHELMRDLIPGAKLSLINGAGHLPVLERPEETNKELLQWLNR
ncbi:alpha/beta fold hydrolase [Ruegeria hyattellae]|uniref:alpha/beta fold hydrolase n=1 Tax=Ruegeria hyattellae TaxID=3233337 RepID=UPI00355C3569